MGFNQRLFDYIPMLIISRYGVTPPRRNRRLSSTASPATSVASAGQALYRKSISITIGAGFHYSAMN